MLRKFLTLFFICISSGAMSQYVFPDRTNIKFYDKDSYLIEGLAFADSTREFPFDRLPLCYKKKTDRGLWDLSQAAAGVTVRFFTNATTILLKWNLNYKANTIDPYNFCQMPETGLKGIDIYCKTAYGWQYVNTAKPIASNNEFIVINKIGAEMPEYKLFLPLFFEVTRLEIGIDDTCLIKKPDPIAQKPIVFYGSSLTQGSAASRPGMAYPAIISRKLQAGCFNFGFSGHGKMEEFMAKIIADIDASYYVLDCVPNMTADEIRKYSLPFVEMIRKKQPATPIVLVEAVAVEKSFLDTDLQKEMDDKNSALKGQFEKMKVKGFSNIFYVESKNALGSDHEATVDGVHFTDLGHMRYADFLMAKFRAFKLKVVANSLK